MKKVESKFRFEGNDYNLYFNKNNIKCYISDGMGTALITDREDNILFEIGADSAQNCGFLTYGDDTTK